MPNKFSEDNYYNSYKSIRNKFRCYQPLGLIGFCLKYLHHPTAHPLGYIERKPWSVLLLIKWILLDENYDNLCRPMPKYTDTVQLINMVNDLTDKIRMPSEHESFALFMRLLVSQQIIYQRRLTIVQTGRQMLYFGGLNESHYIKEKFRSETGMDLDRFLQLAIAFHTAFVIDNSRRYRIGRNWFGDMKMISGHKDVDLFLSLLSAPLDTIRKRLLERDAITLEKKGNPRASFEYLEQTPFVHSPLLPTGDGDYFIVDSRLVENCLENFVYNTLRRCGAQDFMKSFGDIFEDYVRLAVEHSKVSYRDEEQLKIFLKSKQKSNLVDFVLADEDTHIFIDAKAAEMNYWASVTHDPVELAKLLDSSLLKAIKQANSVARDLAARNSKDSVFSPRQKNYLIAVTYARTNFGNGRALCDCVGMEAVKSAVGGDDNFKIPIENIYFLTIEEFETLVAQVHVGKIGLVEALERAKNLDANPLTRKFIFEQHLTNWGIAGKVPDYLVKKTTDALNQLMDDLIKS